MQSIALITGATSGFGKAIAIKFASAGHDVIITGRRKELLQQVKSEIESAYAVKALTLHFDVRDKKAVNEHLSNIPAEWKKLNIVVNNAGLAAGKDYFDEASMDDWEQMIDTNVKGLLYVSRAALPYLIDNGGGHIVNIGSIAGKQVYEKGNVYCATKHSVDAISHSMRIDLLRHKIKVTAIHPGMAETEFSLVRFKGNEEAAKAVYAGVTPLSADDIADAVYYCTSLPAHVCINDMVIMPTAQADAFYLHKDN
jgi:3-hydroxy acid dehydrogenase/malonic semialdehyde reductase